MSENTKATINILIVFYTRYGNTARMAEEISQEAKEIPETNVAIKRIADYVPVDVISKNSSWTEIVENLNKKYTPIPIEDLVNSFHNMMQLFLVHLLDLAIWQHK